MMTTTTAAAVHAADIERLSAVIERLRCAEGPCLGLDLAIHMVVKLTHRPPGIAVGRAVPRYSASLDVARELVHPDSDWVVDNAGFAGAGPHEPDGGPCRYQYHSHPAISLCCAALLDRVKRLSAPGGQAE